jgi:putative pyruvate formate lyase activating enzyme
MHRQVGDLIIDEHGLAIRGLLVRHLILPNGLAGTDEILCFLAEEISSVGGDLRIGLFVSLYTYLNLMDQYRPDFNAHQFPELDRRPTREEYAQAVKQTRTVGLYRLD